MLTNKHFYEIGHFNAKCLGDVKSGRNNASFGMQIIIKYGAVFVEKKRC